MYEVEDLPATPWWRRLLTVVLALGTAWFVMNAVTGSPVHPDWKPPARADQAPCQPGQTSGCVGGTAAVIVVPPRTAKPATPASTPAR